MQKDSHAAVSNGGSKRMRIQRMEPGDVTMDESGFWGHVSKFPDGARLKVSVSYVSRDGKPAGIAPLEMDLRDDKTAEKLMRALIEAQRSLHGS